MTEWRGTYKLHWVALVAQVRMQGLMPAVDPASGALVVESWAKTVAKVAAARRMNLAVTIVGKSKSERAQGMVTSLSCLYILSRFWIAPGQRGNVSYYVRVTGSIQF